MSSYTETITFPKTRVELTNTSYYDVQVFLEFTRNTAGDNVNYTSAEKNLLIEDYGKREISYDFEDGNLAVQDKTLMIADGSGYLESMFFANSAVSKNAKVTVNINDVEKFVGNIIERTIDYDRDNKVLKFTAVPSTDIINRKTCYSDDYYTFILFAAPVVAPAEGDVYSYNELKFKILRVSLVVGGYSNILTFLISGSSGPAASGDLTKVTGSGDGTLTYTSHIHKAVNPFDYEYATIKLVKDFIEDIFQLANSSLNFADDSIELIHDWVYRGEALSTDNQRINDIVFEELNIPTTPVYFSNLIGVTNCGDVLKKLSLDFGCMAGMTSINKAFFRKLFYYSESNLQSLTVLSWKKGYRYSTIEFVRVTSVTQLDDNEPYDAGTFTEWEDKILKREIFAYFYSDDGDTPRGGNIRADVVRSGYYHFLTSGVSVYPAEGSVYSVGGSNFEIVGVNETDTVITGKRLTGSYTPSGGASLTRVSGSGDASITYTFADQSDDTYQIYSVKDTSVSASFKNQGQLIADFWYNFRGNINNCRVDKFIALGVDYDFLKNFNYSGGKYQIIRMASLDGRGITEIEAIYLGEV